MFVGEAPRARWWMLGVMAVSLVAAEWLVERQSTSAARDAALRAADAASAAAATKLAVHGPLETRGGEWLANGQVVDAHDLEWGGGFAVRLGTDASPCPLPDAEQIVLGERHPVSGYAKLNEQWLVVRCDPVLDRHGQVGGVQVVLAGADGFAGNPWRVRASLAPILALLFGAFAAMFFIERKAERDRWLERAEHAADLERHEAAATLLRARIEELERQAVDLVPPEILPSRLLANVGHELRTPLNAVIGYAELLLTEVPADQRSDTQQILEAARGLGHTIDGLLDLTRLESGTLVIDRQPFDLGALLEDLRVAHQREAMSSGNTLVVEVQPDVSMWTGDARRVRQALDALVSNAVKFTESGTIEVLAFAEDGDVVAIEVRDTGVGMDADTLQRMFEPFAQLDGTETRRHGGTGIGLTLARALADRMGGELRASSVPGEGSTFVLSLPR